MKFGDGGRFMVSVRKLIPEAFFKGFLIKSDAEALPIESSCFGIGHIVGVWWQFSDPCQSGVLTFMQ